MNASNSKRDKRLLLVYAALRQALLVTRSTAGTSEDDLRHAAERLLSFVDLPVFDDGNAALALAAVTLGLVRESCRGADAELREVLNSTADILEAIRSAEPAIDRTDALPSVQLALLAIQLGQDPKRRTVAHCLSRLAEERVDEIYQVLVIPSSPVMAWLEGKDSLGSLPLQPRIHTASVSAQSWPGTSAGLTDTAMVQVVSTAVMAASQLIASRNGPGAVVEEGAAQPKRILPEGSPKFVVLKSKDTVAETEKDWIPEAEAASPRRIDPRRKNLIWAVAGILGALAFIFGTTVDYDGRSPVEAILPVATGSVAATSKQMIPRDVAEQFVHAEEHSQRVALLRDPRHAGMMRDHFEAMAKRGEEVEVEAMRSVRPAIIQGMHQHRFHVTFTDGRSRFLALVEEPGGLYVDWLAYARYGSASWAALLDGSVQEAEMRCMAAPSQYYNFAFTDAERYQAYKITSPDSDEPLYAYVQRRTHRDRILASAVAGSQRRLTLTLRSVNDSHTHQQFLISKVNGLGWATATQDFEESPYALPLPANSVDNTLPQSF